ncbi:hypothetical protein LZ016_00080 [Sphingomonas sp. SM33]|uniref:Uncharacterized protein n=1 Tax=Sphingomonas telluris TaxID=2907998 RepID=A0ABS9VJF6_9SPHN|nr:hypothetical protein [Sphingomonas telluris]MCH8614507.1 hypothetical protein [Sphingomonas telluris]
MRLKFAAALVALPLATTANAANTIYLACSAEEIEGTSHYTQLFTLEGDAIGDSYPTWKYDGIKEWEAQFATAPDDVRGVSSYTFTNIVGQFSKFTEDHGMRHSGCWVTTMKDHALAVSAKLRSRNYIKFEGSLVSDWRPDGKAGVLAVTDWSGNPVGGALSAELAEEEDRPSQHIPDNSVTISGPTRHKMTNAEADAKYAADMADYNEKLAEQQKQVDDYKQAQDEVARKKQEQKLQAEHAAADYQRQLDQHAETVRSQQLEYQKELAKPANAPNAVYRGFWGPDCAAARLSATQGAGTSSTTRFKEVTTRPDGSGCLSQGWWWNVGGGGTATRQ